MSIAKIQSIVLEVLRSVQELSGRSCAGLDPTAKPIGQLDGFDSLCSIEATVMVEEKLGGVDLGVESIFIAEDGRRALTVKEITQRISTLLGTRKGPA